MLSAVWGSWWMSVTKTKDFGSEELNLKFICQKLPWEFSWPGKREFQFYVPRENKSKCSVFLSSHLVDLLITGNKQLSE